MEQNAIELSLMAQKMRCPPSQMIGLEAGSYEAWCLDEAIYLVGVKLEAGAKIRPKRTEDNRELLKRMGL